MAIEFIKKTKEFSLVMKQGKKIVFDSFVFFYWKDQKLVDTVKIGYIASSKVGNAVKRNKAKRRLKHLSMEVLKSSNIQGLYICLVARKSAFHCDYQLIKDSFIQAVNRVV